MVLKKSSQKIMELYTSFIVFRSSQLRCDISGLSVNVGEIQITQSLMLRFHILPISQL